MVTLKDFLEVVNYRVTEGSDYTWRCFGDKPYSLSSWNGEHDGWSLNITFDTGDQTVYMAEVCDYKRNRAYRLINPLYADAYREYAKAHNPKYANQAWDDVDFIDLETDEDWLNKAQAIVDNEDYDTRVSVPLDFSDEELLKYMIMAHERDMTFNDFVVEALKVAIDRERSKLKTFNDEDDGYHD